MTLYSAASVLPDVEVWYTRLSSARTINFEDCLALLSDDEIAKSRRFLDSDDQWRSAASRFVLRAFLGEKMGKGPEDLHFWYGEHGKPFLCQASNAPLVHFNVSHADEVFVVAFSRRGAVGIDIERAQPDREWRDLARRFYSPTESAQLLSLPEHMATAEFLRMWTTKEAYVKATGEGITTTSLSHIETCWTDNVDGAMFLEILGNTDKVMRWQAAPIQVFPGYTTTLVHAVTLPANRGAAT